MVAHNAWYFIFTKMMFLSQIFFLICINLVDFVLFCCDFYSKYWKLMFKRIKNLTKIYNLFYICHPGLFYLAQMWFKKKKFLFLFSSNGCWYDGMRLNWDGFKLIKIILKYLKQSFFCFLHFLIREFLMIKIIFLI